MSMLGLRDISSLTTAPQDRRAVVTELMSWNDERIRDALRRELARQGQAFVVHNRVKDLEELAQAIRLLVPDARVVVGHGQMTPSQLERVMHSFINGEADILVCTTIIESGIDIPTANTMIIDEADLHGLADLHQLRGRVGRFRHRAYCYLVLPRHRVPSELAMRRLQALEGFSMLGAGFRIALRDLEIRGAGNLLGAEQSGHIAAVGYELYCRLLEQAVLQHKRMEEGDGSPLPDPTGTTIDLGLGGIVPEAYVPSPSRRMDVYRRLFRCEHEASLLSVVEDIISAYGALPTPVQRLIDFARIRVLAMAMGVRSIRRRDPDIVFRVTNPRMLEQHLQGMPGRVHLVGTGGRGRYRWGRDLRGLLASGGGAHGPPRGGVRPLRPSRWWRPGGLEAEFWSVPSSLTDASHGVSASNGIVAPGRVPRLHWLSHPVETVADHGTWTRSPMLTEKRREVLPTTRESVTHKFSVNGYEGYLTIGLFEDGQPGEIFMKIAKEGSTLSGLIQGFCRSFSIALQYGLSIEDAVARFKGMHFDPAGPTSNPRIPHASSILDYVARYLEDQFGEEALRNKVA